MGQVPDAYVADVAVDPTNPNHLAVTLDAPTTADCDPFHRPGSCSINLDLATSPDGGVSWQDHPLTSDNGGNASVAFTAQGAVAIPPFGAQALLGGGHVAVLWLDPADPGLDYGSNHRLLRVAVSGDGGASFAAARAITDTRSLFAAAVHDGTLYALFRRGTATTQDMALAISRDQGQTWTLAPVGGGRQLDADWSPAPGLSVAPNGALDAVYYAPERPCFDPAALATARAEATVRKEATAWTDPCTYDVWYTGSKDGGKTWTAPRRLNPQPIRGAQFFRLGGMSRPGDYIGIASTNQDAYPVWIARAAACVARIER